MGLSQSVSPEPGDDENREAEWLDGVIRQFSTVEMQRGSLQAMAASQSLAREEQTPSEVSSVIAALEDTVDLLQRVLPLKDRTPEDTVAFEAPPASDPAKWDPFPDEFRIERKLGGGQFGEVWLAFDVNLKCHRALKVLKGSFQNLKGDAFRSFEDDARMLAAMRHPNIIGIHAWRIDQDRPVLVLDYVAGGSFEDLLRRDGELAWDTAGRYVCDVAEALSHVHAKGVLHRDIKPANLLHDPDRDEAILTDFGLAQHLSNITSVAGSPGYMPPEAFLGQYSEKTDVYSLAATLFRFVVGEVLFPGARLAQVPKLAEQGLAADDRRLAVAPSFVESLIRCALSVDPSRRPTAKEFAEKLRAGLNQSITSVWVAADAAETSPVKLAIQIRKSNFAANSAAAIKPNLPTPVGSRNMRRVPQEPASVKLETGDRIQIEVLADRDGFLTLFNVGPSGSLNLLYPDPEFGDRPTANLPDLLANQPRLIIDEIEITPPAGTERLCAIWSAQPVPFSQSELVSVYRSKSDGHVSLPYQATRDMKRVQSRLQNLSPGTWHAVVLQVEHQEPIT